MLRGAKPWVVTAGITAAAGCSSTPGETRVSDDPCSPFRIASDNDHIFGISTCNGGSIVAISKSDWSLSYLASNTPMAGRSLALDDLYVYWSQYDRYSGELLRIPKGGGSQTVIANSRSGPVSLFVDDTNVYWEDELQAGGIYRAPKDGSGTPTTVVPGNVSLLAFDGVRLVWRSGDAIYSTDKTDASSTQQLYSYAVPTAARCAISTGRGVFVWDVPESTPERLSSRLLLIPNVIETWNGDTGVCGADDRNLYWSETDQFVRQPIAGGNPEAIATIQPLTILSMTQDSEYLYWGYFDMSPGLYRAHK